MRWVRPALTTCANCRCFLRSAPASFDAAGIRSSVTAAAAARCTADGKTSLDDWDAFTWSLGCTAPASPNRADARLASTSFMFMFVEVPEPVWNASIGNSSG